MMQVHRIVLIAAALLATLALATAAALHYRAARPVTLTLRFHLFVGPEPLVANELRYANPGGDGRFEVRDFQFFLSNIRLAGETEDYAEPGSYHLLRFDAGQAAPVVTLRDIPPGDYDRIEFGIGVDPAANRSIEAVGDLDPNGRMAWTWEVGYKFVLLEGALVRDGERSPLVYHVGFEENYRPLSTRIDSTSWGTGNVILDFRVDLL